MKIYKKRIYAADATDEYSYLDDIVDACKNLKGIDYIEYANEFDEPDDYLVVYTAQSSTSALNRRIKGLINTLSVHGIDVDYIDDQSCGKFILIHVNGYCRMNQFKYN